GERRVLVADRAPVENDAIVLRAREVEHHHGDLAERSSLDGLNHLWIGKRLRDAFALKMRFHLVDARRYVGCDDELNIDGLAGFARNRESARLRGMCRREGAGHEETKEEGNNESQVTHARSYWALARGRIVVRAAEHDVDHFFFGVAQELTDALFTADA